MELKPKFRGVFHQAAFFVAAGAGAMLLIEGKNPRAILASAIYVVTLLALFGVSALYHRGNWSARATEIMQRVDLATIFVFIAGCYTPICLLAFHGVLGVILLRLAWLCAGLGVFQAILWPRAPRFLSAALYVLNGSLLVAFFPAAIPALGEPVMGVLVAGGLCYILGAIVYVLRRPNPLPKIFGYHEIFHSLVIMGSLCQFMVVVHLVTKS